MNNWNSHTAIRILIINYNLILREGPEALYTEFQQRIR